MEILAATSLPDEPEMENYPYSSMYNNYQMNYEPEYYSLDQLMNCQCLSSDHCCTTSTMFVSDHEDQNPIRNVEPAEFPPADILRPAKQLKSNKQASPSSSSSLLISFENSNKIPIVPQFEEMKNSSAGYEQGVMMTMRAGNASRRSPISSWKHAIAQKNRREKLTQLIIDLSSVIPGLKKTDKASVLDEAIKYVKHLEERVKTLEEREAKKTVKSVVFTKRSSQFSNIDEIIFPSDHEENFDSCLDKMALPEIEARVSDKDVLIRIHCKKRKGVYLADILSEIEKLHLTIVNTNVLPFFGNTCTIHITIVAQMNENFCMEFEETRKTSERKASQGLQLKSYIGITMAGEGEKNEPDQDYSDYGSSF